MAVHYCEVNYNSGGKRKCVLCKEFCYYWHLQKRRQTCAWNFNPREYHKFNQTTFDRFLNIGYTPLNTINSIKQHLTNSGFNFRVGYTPIIAKPAGRRPSHRPQPVTPRIRRRGSLHLTAPRPPNSSSFIPRRPASSKPFKIGIAISDTSTLNITESIGTRFLPFALVDYRGWPVWEAQWLVR